jgi:hypothetical protein
MSGVEVKGNQKEETSKRAPGNLHEGCGKDESTRSTRRKRVD